MDFHHIPLKYQIINILCTSVQTIILNYLVVIIIKIFCYFIILNKKSVVDIC